MDFLSTLTRPGIVLDEIDDDTNLVNAEVIDSLALLQIVFYLEQNHNLHIQAMGIDPGNLETINGIVSVIEHARK